MRHEEEEEAAEKNNIAYSMCFFFSFAIYR